MSPKRALISSTGSTAASSPVTKNWIDRLVVLAMTCNQETRREVLILAKESTDHEEESSNSDMKSTDDDEESSDPDYYTEAESKKILQEMETISREVQESQFYSELHKQIKSEEFQSQLTRVLSSRSHDVLFML